MLPDEFTGGIMEKLLECKEVKVSKLIFATVSLDGFRSNPNNGATMATGQVNIREWILSPVLILPILVKHLSAKDLTSKMQLEMQYAMLVKLPPLKQ